MFCHDPHVSKVFGVSFYGRQQSLSRGGHLLEFGHGALSAFSKRFLGGKSNIMFSHHHFPSFGYNIAGGYIQNRRVEIGDVLIGISNRGEMVGYCVFTCLGFEDYICSRSCWMLAKAFAFLI